VAAGSAVWPRTCACSLRASEHGSCGRVDACTYVPARAVAGFVRLMWEVLPVAHARKERPRLASSFTTRFTTDGLPQIHRGFAVSLCNVRRLLALPDDLVGATLAVRAAGEPKVLCFSKASNAARSSLVGSYSSKSIVGVDSRHAMIQERLYTEPLRSGQASLRELVATVR
jgi:hypothetical protein